MITREGPHFSLIWLKVRTLAGDHVTSEIKTKIKNKLMRKKSTDVEKGELEEL